MNTTIICNNKKVALILINVLSGLQCDVVIWFFFFWRPNFPRVYLSWVFSKTVRPISMGFLLRDYVFSAA